MLCVLVFDLQCMLGFGWYLVVVAFSGWTLIGCWVLLLVDTDLVAARCSTGWLLCGFGFSLLLI